MGIVSISVPRKLLHEIEEIGKERGYSSRSEIVRDSLRKYIQEYQKLKMIKGNVVGNITVIHKNEDKKIGENLRELQHKFDEVIVTALHMHFDEENCLNLFVVKGEHEKFSDFLSSLEALRGEKKISYSISEIQ